MFRMISDEMPEHSIAREFGLKYDVLPECDDNGGYVDVRFAAITSTRGSDSNVQVQEGIIRTFRIISDTHVIYR